MANQDLQEQIENRISEDEMKILMYVEWDEHRELFIRINGEIQRWKVDLSGDLWSYYTSNDDWHLCDRGAFHLIPITELFVSEQLALWIHIHRSPEITIDDTCERLLSWPPARPLSLIYK